MDDQPSVPGAAATLLSPPHSSEREEGEMTEISPSSSSSPPPPHLESTRPQPKLKICFWWYHDLTCDRNPANPDRKSGKPCLASHTLDGVDMKTARLTYFPKWMHRQVCGLPLCPCRELGWSNRKPKNKNTVKDVVSNGTAEDSGGKANGRKRKRQAEPKEMPATKRSKPNNPPNPLRPVRHRDDPTKRVARPTVLLYDDEKPAATSTTEEAPLEQTCFFWYHGRCSRSLDARTSYTCDYLHALTDPPTMVQPPPGYTHAKPCTLQWCPGDARIGSKAGGKAVGSDGLKGLEHGEVSKRRKVRYAEGKDRDKGDDAVSECSDAPSYGQLEEREEWYLQGFDEV